MQLKTAAVFGGSGKIGRRLIPLLQERGLQVRALKHKGPLPAGASALEGSIADPSAVRELVAGADVVVQLATTKEDPGSYFDVTLRGMMNILEACRDEQPQQLILLGGDAAFGIWFYPQPVPIDENHVYAAYPGHYAFTKVIEEVMAQQYGIQYGLPVTILRSSWVFEGDDLLQHLSLLKNVNPAEKGHGFGIITSEIEALLEAGEERIPILTDASGAPLKRHIVHAEDVEQAFERLLGRPEALGRSFNVAGPAPFSYDQAAQYLSKKTGIPTVRLSCPHYHSFEIDISRARSVLGYAPRNDIFRMIDRALAYRREKEEA